MTLWDCRKVGTSHISKLEEDALVNKLRGSREPYEIRPSIALDHNNDFHPPMHFERLKALLDVSEPPRAKKSLEIWGKIVAPVITATLIGILGLIINKVFVEDDATKLHLKRTEELSGILQRLDPVNDRDNFVLAAGSLVALEKTQASRDVLAYILTILTSSKKCEDAAAVLTEVVQKAERTGSPAPGLLERMFVPQVTQPPNMPEALKRLRDTTAAVTIPNPKLDDRQRYTASGVSHTGGSQQAPPATHPSGSTTASPDKPPRTTAVNARPQGKGTININSIPASRVILDGKSLGETPQTVTISAGPHTVVFIHPEHGRKTSAVNVMPEATSTATVRFP